MQLPLGCSSPQTRPWFILGTCLAMPRRTRAGAVSIPRLAAWLSLRGTRPGFSRCPHLEARFAGYCASRKPERVPHTVSVRRCLAALRSGGAEPRGFPKNRPCRIGNVEAAMSDKRAERRHHLDRMKAKARRIFLRFNRDDARRPEKLANHLAFCSRLCCSNPRKHFGQPTLQEKRAAFSCS